MQVVSLTLRFEYDEVESWLCVAVAFLPRILPAVRCSGQSSNPADAIALEQQGKLAEAAETWRAVIQKNPNDAAAYASLGVVLSKEQKYKEAASAYKKALALNPNLPGVQLNLGLAEFKQGNFQAAIAPLRAASAADRSKSSGSYAAGVELLRRKAFCGGREVS